MGQGWRSPFGVRAGRERQLIRRLAVVLATAALLSQEVGAAAASPTTASIGSPTTEAPTPPIENAITAAAIPYDQSGGDSAPSSSNDPSIHLRPKFVPSRPPSLRTALKAQWTADKRLFANPNGSFDLQLGTGLNYKDASGEWQAIDLSLVDAGNGHYHPAAAPEALDLNASAGDTGIATLAGDDGTISLRTLGYGAGGRFDKGLRFPGTNGQPDVWVQPTGPGFEFGATFAGPNTGPGTTFVLDPGSLKPSLEADGQTIDFGLADGTVVGAISPPTVVDARGAAADASTVAVSLAARGDGSYLLGYMINAAWMHAAGRQFPVTLDPSACIRGGGGTTCTKNSGGTTDDLWYGSGLPTSWVDDSTTNFLHVGYYQASGTGWGQTRAALFFDPSSISLPDGSVITNATLNMRENQNFSGAMTAKIYARMIKLAPGTGWAINTSTATYNFLGNAVESSAYDSPSYSPCGTGTGDCTIPIDVTKSVIAWFNRTPTAWKPNVGFQLRYVTEGTTSPYYETSFYRYRAGNGTTGTATDRPTLNITYEAGGYNIDFDPALGPTYAPSSAVIGQNLVLPVKVTNTGSVSFDGTNEKLGYRWFDWKGNLVAGAAGSVGMPAVASGATSTVFAATIPPPSSAGRYTLRLDVAHVVPTTTAYYSDGATPKLFFSRDKKVLTSDSTRWTGSSVMERDEFSIMVSNGQGGGSDAKTVSLGSVGDAAIDLRSRNLEFTGDTGIAVDDRIPLTLTYGYSSKDAADGCTGYIGLLGACGWFTNYDERLVATSDSGYDYYDPNGNVYRTDTDTDGQLSGAPVQLTRQRVTLFDENRPTSGGATLVSAGSAGIPIVSGNNVISASGSTTTLLNGFLDGASTREISLNAYRTLDFQIRTNAANSNIELCPLIDDKTNGKSEYFCIQPYTDWDTSHERLSMGFAASNVWAHITIDLWQVVSGTIGSASTLGAKTDQYFIKGLEAIGSSANTGKTIWLDAVNLYPVYAGSASSSTAWDAGSGTLTNVTTNTVALGGGYLLTSAASCTGTCYRNPSQTPPFHDFLPHTILNGVYYGPATGTLAASPYFSWWWKKDGGTAAAVTFCLTDGRTSATGELNYFAGPNPPTTVKDCPGKTAADRHFIQVSPTLPGLSGTTTRVIRNVLEDARQALYFYKDDDVGANSATPPTQGPTGDDVQVTGFVWDPVDGSDLIMSDFGFVSIGEGWRDLYENRYQNNPTRFDTLNYYLPITIFPWYMDDFFAEYPDGTTHWFNRDGLLTRIVTKDGSELDLGWSYNSSGTGASAYTLNSISAPTDNTMDTPGGARQYRHRLSVTRTSITGFNQITFQELLGTVAMPMTGRRADFYAATTTGTTWGVGDLVKVSQARHNTASCGAHSPTGSGCIEFEYTSATSHLLFRAADPRWDGSASGANDYRFEFGWSGSDPVSVNTRSPSLTPLLRVLSFDRGRTASPLYLRPLWQDALAMAMAAPPTSTNQYALHEDLSPDGSPLTTYIRQACSSSDCSPSTAWPAGDNATLATRIASSRYFDGLSNVTIETTYRCPGVAAGGCTGTQPLVSITRQATNAAAKVENYSDVLASRLLAWSQTADQYFASMRDSSGSNPDLYRTEYTYDAASNAVLVEAPGFARVTDYAGTVKTRDGLWAYYRMNDAGTTLADSSGSGRNGIYTGSPSMQVSGSLVRDTTNKAVALNGTTQYGSVTGATMGTVTGSYTVEAWVKSTSASATQAFVGTRNGAFGFDAKLCADATNCASKQNIRVEVGDGAKWLVQGNLPFAWAANRWYDIAVEVDTATSSALVFVDGDPVGRLPFTASGTPILTDGSHNFYIGTNGAGSESFAGAIDEVSVYTTALDASEVRSASLAGLGIAQLRTETIYHQNPSTVESGADPTQRATVFATNGDFENGLWAWNTSHGAQYIHWDTNTSGLPAYGGGIAGAENGGALRINSTSYTDQLVQIVPGQRVHFQLAGVTSGGAARATYRVDYWQISTGSWQTLLAENSFSSTSWSVAASEFTIPLDDTTGLVKITLRNNGATGDAAFDDLLLIGSWQTWTYGIFLTDLSPNGTNDAYMMEGLLYSTTSLSPKGDGSLRKDTISYAADDSHQAIFPTQAIANYVDGVQGPAADQDVISSTTFDSWGRALVTTDPDGVFKANLYSPTNLSDLVQTSDNLTNPPLVPATTMTYDAVGNLLSTLTPQGRLTASTYDLLNHTLTTTAADGTVSRSDYDNYGRVTASWANYLAGSPSADHDLLTIFGYDEYGRAIQQDIDCGSVATCTAGGLDARTTTTYDLLGDIVAKTTYPGAGGTGTARITTNFYETTGSNPTLTRPSASGQQLPIVATGSSAPVCPGATSTPCNTAAVWTWNGAPQSAVDMNGRTFGTTDAYGVVNLVDHDLAGHAVQEIANYSTGADDGLNDQNVTKRAQYSLAGTPLVASEVLSHSPLVTRSQTSTYDALGRKLTATQYGSDGNSFGSETRTYTPGGRVSTINDGASTTKTVYDPAGRALRTIANYDTGGNAGMTLEAFESGTDSWSTASSGFFTTGAATSMGLDEDSQGNESTTVAPVSGRGRLGFRTDATNTVDGAWLDLTASSPPVTYQSGHTYKVAFDIVGGQSGVALRAFLGQDHSGGSYSEYTGGISTTTAWQRLSFTWTPSSNISTNVHFAVRKDTAGSADIYLDNVVVWDTTSGWTDKGIVSSETAYDLDGQAIGSVLPPGDPATDEPLVTTVALDIAGRTLETVVNGASGSHAAAVQGTTGLAAYFPLDEQWAMQPIDDHTGTPLTNTGGVLLGVAGGIDEARMAGRFIGGYLYENSNVTTATTNVAMEAWVRADAAPGGANTVIVASNGDTSNSWGLGITPAGEAAGFVQKSSNPNAGFWTIAATGVVVTDGAWHHLSFSRASSTWTLTVDGTSRTLTNSSKDPGTPGAKFTIGAWADGSRAFTGDIDEVSAYTANIGVSTGLAHYQAGHRTDTVTGLTTRTNFDNLGRAIDTWAPDGTRTKAVFDRLGNRTVTWMDYKDGVTSSSTGDDDIESTFAYDVLGEVVGYCPAKQVKAGGCDPSSSSNTQAWHYAFDAMGRQVTSKPPDNQSAADLNMTETVYETGGRIAKTCVYPAYPAQGSCTGTASTRHSDYTYDGLARILTSKVYDRSTGSDVLKFTKTLTWNPDSTPATVAESGDTLTYAYDPAGRLASFKRGATTLTSYAYNATTGTLTSRTDGTIGTTTFGYDWARRNNSIAPPAAFGGTINRTFRLDGNLATQAFPNGVTEALSYDAARRPTRIDMGTTGYLTQTIDRAGRVLTDGRSFTGVTGDPGTGLQSFSYDGASRVTGSTGLSATHAYSYDLDGNRLTKTDGSTSTTYTYDRTDELISQVISGTTRNFVYDAFGNMTTSADAASTLTTYAYDEANRLTSIIPASGPAATFTLDALGRVKTRTVGTNTDTYGYLGTTETAYETGAATTDGIYDAAGARIAIKTGSTISYVIFDLHGSVVALCPSTSSALSDAYRYDPWGQVQSSGTATNPWRYRGLLDVSPNATPLLDMGARYYSPQLGTFTAEDSVAGKAVDPMSMNAFLYAEGNPTTLIDPDGHAIVPNQGLCMYGPEDCAELRKEGVQIDPKTGRVSASHDSKPAPTVVNVHLVAGIPITSHGLIARPEDFDRMSNACQDAGRPAPEFAGGVCDAWWKTYDAMHDLRIHGGDPDSAFIDDAALATLDKALSDLAKANLAQYPTDIRIAYTDLGKQIANGASGEAGAEVYAAEYLAYSGKLAKLAGYGTLLVGTAVDMVTSFTKQLASDKGRGYSVPVEIGRITIRTSFNVFGGAAAGFVAGLGATVACEIGTALLGTPECGALFIAIVAGLGAASGSQWGDEQADKFFGWIDGGAP